MDVYLDTVDVCDADESGYQTTNSVPVCGLMNTGSFIPDSDVISVFSFDCVPEEGVGA